MYDGLQINYDLSHINSEEEQLKLIMIYAFQLQVGSVRLEFLIGSNISIWKGYRINLKELI